MQYSGTDPAVAKKAERTAETFAELAHDYIERYAKRQKRSWRKDLLILEKDAFSRFGKRKAKDITRRDIITMLDEIVSRGAPIQANRTLEIIRKLFNWAVARDILGANPCYRVPKPSNENRSDRVLSEEEIRVVWLALAAETPDRLGYRLFSLKTKSHGQVRDDLRGKGCRRRNVWKIFLNGCARTRCVSTLVVVG